MMGRIWMFILSNPTECTACEPSGYCIPAAMKMMMSRNFSIVPALGSCFADGHLILSYIILNCLLGVQTVCTDPHLTDVLVMVCGVYVYTFLLSS